MNYTVIITDIQNPEPPESFTQWTKKHQVSDLEISESEVSFTISTDMDSWTLHNELREFFPDEDIEWW